MTRQKHVVSSKLPSLRTVAAQLGMPYTEAMKISAVARASVREFLTHDEVRVAGQALLDAVMREHTASVSWGKFTPGDSKRSKQHDERLLLAIRKAKMKSQAKPRRYARARLKSGT